MNVAVRKLDSPCEYAKRQRIVGEYRASEQSRLDTIFAACERLRGLEAALIHAAQALACGAHPVHTGAALVSLATAIAAEAASVTQSNGGAFRMAKPDGWPDHAVVWPPDGIAP